jgi:hypothetical protein
MVDAHLPRIVAGYAYPLCPTCDKQFGPEIADVGPVQCDTCGKWFEVTTLTVYQAEQMLDYQGDKPDAASKPRKQPHGEPSA